MNPTRSARKIILPTFVVTETAAPDEAGAVKVSIPPHENHPGATYYTRAKKIAVDGERRDGKPRWVEHQFNLFPAVFDGAGVPWAEACVYILARLESQLHPSMSTYASIAEDLAAYRRFLDETGLDWTSFPRSKLDRPTYRYNGSLKSLVAAGELAAATAKRRMSTVIAFYTWLQQEKALQPEHAPWLETDRFIQLKDAVGRAYTKKVTTTNLAIKASKQADPYAGLIQDGGALRPLPREEQEWVLSALGALGNTEMTLIHLMALLTGARIQTALTFRVRHALVELDGVTARELRFPVGPGTGIDTKHDKPHVLHLPTWYYRMLQTYTLSQRARTRRERAAGGDHEDQYLFLSVRGSPLYRSKTDAQAFDASNTLRHAKVGQGVRQFITDYVIPWVRTNCKGAADFHYRFHDLRASFGMNLTEDQLALVSQGHITLAQAREYVKTRMGHESAATTDLYPNHRHNLKMVRQVNDDYADHLKSLVERALQGSA